jgi:hypothetical protein
MVWPKVTAAGGGPIICWIFCPKPGRLPKQHPDPGTGQGLAFRRERRNSKRKASGIPSPLRRSFLGQSTNGFWIRVFKTDHRLWITFTGVQYGTPPTKADGASFARAVLSPSSPVRPSSTANNDGLSSRRRPSWGRHFVRIGQSERLPQHSQSGRRRQACVCRAGLASQYCSLVKN